MLANVVTSLQTVGSFLRAKRKLVGIFLICLIIGLAASSVLVGPAYAGTDIGQLVTVDFWIGLLASIILAIAGWFIKLTIFILSFVILLAGYNGYLDSAAVNVGWVIVRDITNMGFVVILLIIAFGTILGLEQYEWKKLLGKFVFAAIIVNFSRTICGVIIDIAQVIMTTFVNGIAATAGGNLINAFQLNRILELSSGVTPANITVTAQFIAAVGGITFAAMVMGVMFVFLYMLIARMVVLWVLIVLSPLAFVLSILPGTESYAGQWWSKFIANVITGPVLLFFVWLSFVTLGSGNISADIAEHSTSPNKLDSNGADALGSSEQSSGISAVMAWPRMASFAIAIGMLLVGAKAAEELGGEGASAVGSALDFGKKVGSYASGLSAARWAGGHVAEGAADAVKFAAMKAPLVGGQRWINRGKTIASFAKLRLGKGEEWRNEQAKKIEKWAQKKKGMSKVGATALALIGRTAIESGGRQSKRAEDWEKAAENQAKIVEESYGTSSSLGGKAKLDTGVRAHQAEHLSSVKRDQKYAKKEAELMADHGEKRFHEREQVAFDAQAEAENIKKSLDREKAVTVAQKRAEQLRAVGKNAEAAAIVKSAYNSQFEEDQKAFVGMGQNEKVNEAVQIAGETAALDAKLLAGTITKAEEGKLKNLRKGAAQLIAAAAKDGQETYATVMRAMLQEVRGNSDMSAESSGQDILQAITGRASITNAAQFEAAHELITGKLDASGKLVGGDKTFRNNDEAQAVLSLIGDATKSLALKGENRAAGAVEELPADVAILNANQVAASQGSTTAFRLFNQHAGGRVVRVSGQTAASLKSDMQGYFAPRVDLKQAEYIQGFGSTNGANQATSLDVDDLFARMSKFKDTRDVSSGFSSAFSDSTKRAKITGAANAHVVSLLSRLNTHYGVADHDVYLKIRDTVFKEWVGVAGVP